MQKPVYILVYTGFNLYIYSIYFLKVHPDLCPEKL